MTRKELILVLLLACLLAGALTWYAYHTAAREASLPPVRELRATFERAIVEKGGDAAYATEMVKRYRNSEAQHSIAHIFGETLYEVEGADGVRVCDSRFLYGCFHGFFTRAVDREGLGILPKLAAACQTHSVERGAACEHGIGHGIIEFLGQERIHDAMPLCAQVNPDVRVLGCFSGAFMQYHLPQESGSSAVGASAVREPADEDKPLDPCPTLAREYQAACYHALPTWWKKLYAGEREHVANLCDVIRDRAMRLTCFHGLALVVAAPDYDARTVVEWCGMVEDEEGRDMCLRAAAYNVYMHKGTLAGHTVCAALESNQDTCPSAVPIPQ